MTIPVLPRRLAHTLLLCAAAVCSASALAQQQFPVIPLTAGMYVIHAEVAAREAEREQGLMFREKMNAGDGMVFVFDAPATTCMWMKNTLIPLSVAFIDESGKIINIEDMKPQTTDSHCTARPARYALEMNLGWFKQKGIKPGSMIGGLPGMAKTSEK
jgi:uncharacterized membrane protein (UPF0127 family)